MKAWATEHVPHVATLGSECWSDACNRWLKGLILTEEVRRLVTNFASVTSVRPQERDVEAANSQDDNSDVECFITPEA